MKKFDLIPQELRERDQWVLWKLSNRVGSDKPTKVPFQINGGFADSTNPLTWSSFEQVIKAYQNSLGKYSGIGYVFSESDPYTGVDIDNCVTNGVLTEEAVRVIHGLNSYAEVSQSRSGVHVIVNAAKPGNRHRTANYEIYDRSRFFVVTGDHLVETPRTIENRQLELNALYASLFPELDREVRGSPQSLRVTLEDHEILGRASEGKNADRFVDLYTGDTSGYGSHSEADQALCNFIAFYTKDQAQIDRIFRGSGLFREKWERQDYRERTIQAALTSVTAVYDSKKNSPNLGATANTIISETTNLNEWTEPIWLDEVSLPIFPVNVFPVALSRFIYSAAESTQTPVDASSMAMIAALSTTLAKKVRINPHGGYVEPVNTYTVVALPPGNRKSAVFQLIQKPIYEFEMEERKRLAPIAAEQAAFLDMQKKLLEKLKLDYSKGKDVSEEIKLLAREIQEFEGSRQYLPRYITDDITQEKLVGLMAENNEKMANLSAEGGLFDIIAGRYSKGRPNLEIFLKGHSGDACTVDRMGRSENMIAPALTLGLFVQPVVLQNLPTEFAGRGLMARFLFCLPQSIVGERIIRPQPMPESVYAGYQHLITRLMQYAPAESVLLRPTLEADEYLCTVQTMLEPRLLVNGDLCAVVEWASKLVGQALRIVALLHVAQYADTLPKLPTEISLATMKKGLSLIEYFISHAKKAFNYMKSAEDVENVRYLWVKLKAMNDSQNRDCFTKQEVWRLVRGKFGTAEPFDAALKSLIDRNYIQLVTGGSGKVGRNTNLIFLNPMAIMAKITTETDKTNNYSHFSHDILQSPKQDVLAEDQCDDEVLLI